MESAAKIEPQASSLNPFHKAPPAPVNPSLFTRPEIHQYLEKMDPKTMPGEDGHNIDVQA